MLMCALFLGGQGSKFYRVHLFSWLVAIDGVYERLGMYRARKQRRAGASSKFYSATCFSLFTLILETLRWKTEWTQVSVILLAAVTRLVTNSAPTASAVMLLQQETSCPNHPQLRQLPTCLFTLVLSSLNTCWKYQTSSSPCEEVETALFSFKSLVISLTRAQDTSPQNTAYRLYDTKSYVNRVLAPLLLPSISVPVKHFRAIVFSA